MKRNDRLGLRLMFTTVSPAALMLAGIFAAGGAAAVDQVVAEGTTKPAGVTLADGDSLTNDGTITNAGNPAVDYPGPNTGGVAFILNGETGTIQATGGWAIGLNGSLGRFENHGAVSTDTDAALGVGGDLGTFINTGTMTTTDGAGVGVNGTVGSFDNSGTITGAHDPAAVFNGAVGTFANSGIMQSATTWTTIFFEDGVTSFDNSGTILNTSSGKGVEVDLNNAAVGSFNNSGTITAGTGQVGVGLFGNAYTVGAFTNSGTITGNTNEAVAIEGALGSFTNSGTLTGGNYNAVFLNKGVDSFINTETGVIQNVASNGNGGNGVGFEIDLVTGGQVSAFENHGTIAGDAAAAESVGVGFFDNGNGAFDVGSFVNTGTISGSGNGVNSNGGFGAFTNSGTIAGNLWQGVRAQGPVGTFTNSGTISSVQDNAVGLKDTTGAFTNSGTITSEQGRGVQFDGLVTSFTNSGIIDSERNGVSFGGGVTAGTNTGTIISHAATNEIGVRIDGPGSTFTNSGIIEGASAVAYASSTGPNILINSGTLRGTDGGAVWFNNGDDLLRLQTGSQIFGDIGFNGGDDTIDVSGFSGNTLLRVYDLENVLPGDKLVHFDQPNDLLAVVEPAGVTAPAQLAATGLAGQVHNLLGPVLNGLGTTGGAPIEPLGYMPLAPQTAADLAIVEPAPADARAWATAIGGGSTDTSPVDISSLYGALLAGTHAQLAGDTTLGALVGIGQGRVDINTGNHIVDSTTGIAGLYGRHMAGVVSLDFSLLAGISGHHSARQVVALGALETARADYASWFIAPAVGVAIPVLQLDTGDVDLVGRVSYVGGSVAGYTETGSSLNLTVGNQAIGLLDARIGLEGTFDVDGADTVLNANAGLFAQSNLGGATVPVTFLGQTQNAAVAGGTELGLYGGVGLSTNVSPNVTLTAGADAQWHFSGQVSGAVRAGLSAGF